MQSIPVYNPIQLIEIQDFIYDVFGGSEEDMIAHELTSAYVHTDTHIIAPRGERRAFVTCGMGARKMNAPRPDLCRAELFMYASKNFDPDSPEAMVLVEELVSLSKFPFREETWLHHGHTIEASSAFRETFGFDAFALLGVQYAQVDGIGEVDYLQVIPIYNVEREWIMETNTVAGCMLLETVFGEELLFADSRRGKFVPDAEVLRELENYLEW